MSNYIEFKVNVHKALEVILWLATKKTNIGYHALLKILFFADEYHFNHYGRPIVGDVYLAMEYGPVASTTYEILKKEALVAELLEDLPFENVNKKIIPNREPNLRKLSASDIEALEYAVNTYGHYDFSSLTDISHQHPAWKKARKHGEYNARMDYKDFLWESDAEIVQELMEDSSFIRI
jgi:uncharacterized phage-associated protein